MSYSKRYVAMCDILGFKNFIKDTKLKNAVEQFQKLRDKAIGRGTTRNVHSIDKVEGCSLKVEKIPWVIFSDTLLMWVDITSPKFRCLRYELSKAPELRQYGYVIRNAAGEIQRWKIPTRPVRGGDVCEQKLDFQKVQI